MTEIAIVKRFGNFQNERNTNYKLLECEDGRRLHIHDNEISCLEAELKRGRFITFEIEGKEAKNLRLFREVGVIDWYRTDKGFGCATLIRNDLLQMFDSRQTDRSEVFVHSNQIISSSKDLAKGELVVFDIRKTYRKDKDKYRDDAINLTILSEETDNTIIEHCARSEEARLWLPVFHKYIITIQTTDEKVSFALDKINNLCRISELQNPSISESRQRIVKLVTAAYELKVNLNFPSRLSTVSKQCLSDSLPEDVLRFSQEVRKFLPLNKHIDVTVALIEDTKGTDQPQNALLNELRSCLENLNQLNAAWNKIPDWILMKEEIWSLVPTNRRTSILLSQLENPSTYQNTVDKIADLLKSSPDNERNSLISQIPLKVKRHNNIFPLLPVTDKVEIIIFQIQEAKEANEPLDTLLNELEAYLKQVAHYSAVWNKIPTDILLKQEIWDLVPVNRQTSLVLYQLDNSSSDENAIARLAKLLCNCSGYEWTSLISKIPDNVKQHEKIFPLLPNTDRVEILVQQLREGEQENTSISSQIESIISRVPFSDRQSIISNLPGWVKEIPSIRASLFKIPSVGSRPDTVEASQIRAFIAERGIDCLCHFTTIENLQGICREGGLLSIRQLRSRNSHYDQIDEGRWDGKRNHICCSINSYNSMYLYHARNKSQCWVLLAIKPDYLWKQGTLFCPINAASERGAYIRSGFVGLQSMYEPVVIDIKGRQYDRQEIGLADFEPTCIQAEVLVYESISLDDILLIWGTSDNEQIVRDAGWKGQIEIDKGIFK